MSNKKDCPRITQITLMGGVNATRHNITHHVMHPCNPCNPWTIKLRGNLPIMSKKRVVHEPIRRLAESSAKPITRITRMRGVNATRQNVIHHVMHSC